MDSPSPTSDDQSEIAGRLRALIDEDRLGESSASSDELNIAECLSLLEEIWPDREPAENAATDRNGARSSESSGTEPLLPRRFGRFELRKLLGYGGFGIVVLAWDEMLDREVALKLPRPELLLSKEMRSRFLREAKAAGVLDHRGIVPVFDAGEIGPAWYIAAGYVKGPSLAQWLSESTAGLSHSAAAQFVAELADAVQHAHSRGILHRDLKPSNVMLEPREGCSNALPFTPKLTDFGLAKRMAGDDDLTLSGAQIGTPRYMAPEQAANRNKEVGITTDVYALGAILHELLAGEPPFVGQSNSDVLQQIQQCELSPARLRNRGVPRDLETICLKCLEKEPARRYPSARDLTDDLRRFLRSEPVLARPISRPARLFRWCRRRPVVAGLASALMLAVTIGTCVALWQWYRAEQHLRGSIAATAEARRHQYQAEQALLNLAWLVEESSLWGQEASQFGAAVEEKLKEYHQAVGSESDARWAPIRGAIHSFEARSADAVADFARADIEYRLALDAWREAVRAHPEKTDYRRALALCLRNFSRLLRGRSRAAGDSDPEAVLRNFYSDLAADKRYGVTFLEDYAELMLDHGGLLLTRNAKAEARESLELGIAAAEISITKASEDESVRLLSGRLWRVLGDVQAAQRERVAAFHSLDRAVEIIEPLAVAAPENTNLLIELAAAYHRRGVLAAGATEHILAVDSMQRAIELCERVATANADDQANRLRRAVSLRYLGNSLQALNRADEAMAVYERHGALLEAMLEHKDLIPADEFRGVARAYHQRGILANANDDYEAATAAFAKGVAAFERAKGFQFGTLDFLFWGECHYFLARRSESLGDKAGAIKHYEEAVGLLKDLAGRRDPHPGVKDRYQRSVSAIAELKKQ